MKFVLALLPYYRNFIVEVGSILPTHVVSDTRKQQYLKLLLEYRSPKYE